MTNVIPLFRPTLPSTNENSIEVPESAAAAPEQMVLPFAAPCVVVQVLVQDLAGEIDFVNFIDSVSPCLIADMRILPRLDFICPNRNQTLALFFSLELNYRDVLGRINAKSYDDACERVNDVLSILLQLADGSDGRPMLAFFDDSKFMSYCGNAMRGLFEPVGMNFREVERAISEGARQRM